MENRNRSRSLAIILVVATSFLGLFSQSAVGVAAATHSWTGSFSNTWSRGSNTWTHNSWSYTNSWSWTQDQNQHSWWHNQHSWQQATTVVSYPYWNGGGQYNGGGYYNNGGYYYGNYYGGQYDGGGYWNGGQYYPSPNQCYPYNGCYPSNSQAPYCPTPSYCPTQVAESVTTVAAQPTPIFTPFTPTDTVTVTAAALQPNFNAASYPPAGYNQNYAPQSTGDDTLLYLGLAVLGVIAVLGVLGIVYAVPRLWPQPIQPAPSRYPQPSVAQSTGSLFCWRCGAPAPHGYVYCSRCGSRLGQAATSTKPYRELTTAF